MIPDNPHKWIVGDGVEGTGKANNAVDGCRRDLCSMSVRRPVTTILSD